MFVISNICWIKCHAFFLQFILNVLFTHFTWWNSCERPECNLIYFFYHFFFVKHMCAWKRPQYICVYIVLYIWLTEPLSNTFLVLADISLSCCYVVFWFWITIEIHSLSDDCVLSQIVENHLSVLVVIISCWFIFIFFYL